jgi:hypothetical protein
LKKYIHFLFWFGVLITSSSFFIGQATRIPFILKIVSPKYCEAMIGYNKLFQNGTLLPEDDGFNLLSEIKLKELSKDNPPELMKQCKIIKFTCDNSLGFYTGKGSIPFQSSSFMFFISNGQSSKWICKDVESELNKIKDKNVLSISFLIFILGLVVNIFSFYFKNDNHSKTIYSPNKTDTK